MNNKKQTKQPLFAEVNLTGDEFRQSPSTHMQRTRFLKLVYPNGVTQILPGNISASQLEHAELLPHVHWLHAQEVVKVGM